MDRDQVKLPDSEENPQQTKQSDDPWEGKISEFAWGRSYVRAEKRAGLIGSVIIIGWVISGCIGAGIVAVTAYLAMSKAEVPDVLSNWGGVIIGFYFGQFFSLIKDYMNMQFDLQRPHQTVPLKSKV